MRVPSKPAPAASGKKDEFEEMNAALIAQMMEEDESRLLAEQLSGSNNNNAAAAGRPNANMGMHDDFEDMADARPQVVEQLVGGRSDEAQRVVEEFERHNAGRIRDQFGAGAEENFPSSFENSNFARMGQAHAAAGGDMANDPMRQTTR